jgi:hypothetical protein
VHPAVIDIESLLAASRELLDAEELEFERLLAWSADRKGVFARFKSRDLSLSADDSSTVAALMRELLAVDAKICAWVSEIQIRLGEQIAMARRLRQGSVRQGPSPSSQLLQRLA